MERQYNSDLRFEKIRYEKGLLHFILKVYETFNIYYTITFFIQINSNFRYSFWQFNIC